VSMTHAPSTDVRRPPVNPWAVVVTALAVAVVALGAWILADRYAGTSQSAASTEVAAMLESRIAAMNRGDSDAAAALYTQTGVLEERDQTPAVVSEGRAEIASRLALLYTAGFRLESLGDPVQSGRFVGEAVRFYELGGAGTGEGVLVFEIDRSGKIAHQWVMGETRP
jgi:hypothetical protein